jgi:hypothetical protein
MELLLGFCAATQVSTLSRGAVTPLGPLRPVVAPTQHPPASPAELCSGYAGGRARKDSLSDTEYYSDAFAVDANKVRSAPAPISNC